MKRAMIPVSARFACKSSLAVALLLAASVAPLPALGADEGSAAAEGLVLQVEGLGDAERLLLSPWFPEPLVRMDAADTGDAADFAKTGQARLDLVSALNAYGESRDRGVLEGFLERYPENGQKVGLLENLGLAALAEGRYSQALEG